MNSLNNYNLLVSIAITTSKSEKYLEEQLRSLINQTYKNIEIVASHDECGDATINILIEYSKKYKNFSYFLNKKQKGFIHNNENAIEKCNGDIIFLCDHDDTWALDKVEEHVKIYKDEKVKWVYNRVVLTDENNEKEIGYLEDLDTNYYRHKSILENTWGTCIGGAITSYRKETLLEALPFPKYIAAHDSWIQFAIWPAKPYFINKVLQNYRQHSNNVSGWKEDTRTQSEIKSAEKKAIENNIEFIKNGFQNRNLKFWKRTLMFVVFVVKKIRKQLK